MPEPARLEDRAAITDQMFRYATATDWLETERHRDVFVPDCARSASDVVEAARRWQELGGSHVSILTMKNGLPDHAAHIEHLAAVKRSIDHRFAT